MPVAAAAREADARVAVLDNFVVEEAFVTACGMAWTKPVRERRATEVERREKRIVEVGGRLRIRSRFRRVLF